jgi:hypothetical protein
MTFARSSFGVVWLTILVAFFGLNATKAGAPPPSFPVQGQITVVKRCVAFGQKITVQGRGFAPETSVDLAAESGHLDLPGGLPRTTVESDQAGEIKASLRAPKGGDGDRWSQLAIVAEGLDRGGKHRGRSFALVVIAKPSVCRFLGRGES